MEKIEVAIRLRPLHCNPAEQSIEYPFSQESTISFEDEESGIWRIEGKNLRLMPNLQSFEAHNRSIGPSLSR